MKHSTDRVGGRYHLSWLSQFPVRSCYEGLTLWLIVTTIDINTCWYQLIYLRLPTLREAIWTKFELGNLFITYKLYFITAQVYSPVYIFVLVLLLLLHSNFVKNKGNDIQILHMVNVLNIIPGSPSFLCLSLLTYKKSFIHCYCQQTKC